MIFRPGDALLAPQIEGANPASEADWPATFVFTGLNQKPCTASAVGPHVILTAAHCVADRSSGKILQNGATVTCRRHKWWGGSGAPYDVALCVSVQKIPLPADAVYETLATQPQRPAQKTSLQLLGFGCTTHGATGFLYAGKASVETPATALQPLFTTTGSASVCAGDSGGGVYEPDGDSRRIVGVASREDGTNGSVFASITADEVRTWIMAWSEKDFDKGIAAKMKVGICGLDEDASHCRR